MRRAAIPILLLLWLTCAIAAINRPLAAQASAGPEPDTAHTTALPPREGMYHAYRPGERLVYDAHVGFLGKVGEGVLEVRADSMRGVPVYNVRLELHASALFGTVTLDDVFQSWLDPRTMRSLRFEKRQDEPRTHTHEIFDFFPDELEWRRADDSDETGPLPTSHPLDDVSFIYYVRALPLEVGDRYVLPDYYKESGNPVVLEVLRRETVSVPAGQFQTIVVRPTIQTRGLFGEGGEAEIYFTDDALHLVVMIKSRLPVLRTLEFRLRSFEM